jgi:hypothetical protein
MSDNQGHSIYEMFLFTLLSFVLIMMFAMENDGEIFPPIITKLKEFYEFYKTNY